MRLAFVVGILVGLLVVDASAFIPGDGKGKADRDCYIGLDGYSPGDLSPISKNGKKQGIACTDCDPACDLDGVATANGTCTFSIAACVNNSGIAGCDPATRDPKKVKAQAKSKAGKIDLGTTIPGDLSSACSAFVDFPVPVKSKKKGDKPGKGKVTLLATKKPDKDKFTFVCNPRPEGEACPLPPTTSSSSTTTIPSTTVTTTSTGQLWQFFRCRCFVYRDLSCLVSYTDSSGPPIAWVLREVVLQHHEMQAAQESFVERKMGILRELEDIGHGISIATDLEPGRLLCVKGIFAVHCGDGVLLTDEIALNTVRAANRLR
jgi:hypothetical protein